MILRNSTGRTRTYRHWPSVPVWPSWKQTLRLACPWGLLQTQVERGAPVGGEGSWTVATSVVPACPFPPQWPRLVNGKIISLRAATLRLKYRIRLSKSHSGRGLFSLEDLLWQGQDAPSGSRLCKTKLPQHHRVAVRTTAAVIPWGFSPAAVPRAVLTSSLRLRPHTFLELMGISRKGTLKRAMLKVSCFDLPREKIREIWQDLCSGLWVMSIHIGLKYW